MNKERYLNYLIRLVDSDGLDPYLPLLRQMHDTIFSESTAKLIPNDDNRIIDGKMLRIRYCERYRMAYDEHIFDEPCSVLEMMVALADKINNQFGIKSRGAWFWNMIVNLHLDLFDDRKYQDDYNEHVADILYGLKRRRYAYNGLGGLFPLNYPERDQRKIEIWSQVNAYLDENY